MAVLLSVAAAPKGLDTDGRFRCRCFSRRSARLRLRPCFAGTVLSGMRGCNTSQDQIESALKGLLKELVVRLLPKFLSDNLWLAVFGETGEVDKPYGIVIFVRFPGQVRR